MADPRHVTIKGASRGHNCQFVISGYGSRVVRAIRIAYGVDIQSSSDEMRDDQAFYTLNVTDSAFQVTAVFLTRTERDKFSQWLVGWARSVSANRDVGGYITVRCPARRFVRTAVLRGGLTFGASVGTVSWPLTMTFVGAEEPTSAIGQGDVAGDSSFQAATKDKVDAPMFYPSYYVNGATGDATEAVIYDREKANLQAIVSDLDTGIVDPILHTLGQVFGGIFGGG